MPSRTLPAIESPSCSPPVNFALEVPNQPEVMALIDTLDAFQQPLYPPEVHYGIDIDALQDPRVLFAVARARDGVAIGCGAMVMRDGYGELKRMFVPAQHRGTGVGRGILQFLETQAAARGCQLFRLETGIYQPDALRLYARAGYVRRNPFSDYADDHHSVFMEKRVPEAGPQ